MKYARHIKLYENVPSKKHEIWINGRRYIDPSEKRIREAKCKLVKITKRFL